MRIRSTHDQTMQPRLPVRLLLKIALVLAMGIGLYWWWSNGMTQDLGHLVEIVRQQVAQTITQHKAAIASAVSGLLVVLVILAVLTDAR